MNSLNAMASDFVGRLSGAVRFGRLTDDAARHALEAFAAAFQRSGWARSGNVRELMLAEYSQRRERQR